MKLNKKRSANLTLVFLVTYMLVFLLYPFYSADLQSTFNCDDTGTELFIGSEDCGPAYLPHAGGGLKFVVAKIKMDKPDPADDVHFFHFENGYFTPLPALTSSAIAALIGLGAFVGIAKLRHKHKS